MRAQFDELIGTPPPSTLDTHAIERRVRRTRAARRVGATTLVAAGLTGVLLIGHQPPAAPPPVAGDTTPRATTAPPDTRFQLKADTRVNGEASARQLAALIEKATADVVPGATWASALNVQFVEQGSESQWTGSGTLRVGGRVGTIFVMTMGAVGPALTCPVGMSGCTEGTSPGGRKMMTFDGGTKADGSRLIRAAVAVPGGRVIIVHHIPEESGPVLSADQFLQILDTVAGQVR